MLYSGLWKHEAQSAYVEYVDVLTDDEVGSPLRHPLYSCNNPTNR